MTTSSRVRTSDVIVIGAPTLVALALCLYELTTRSIYLDESATVSVISQHGNVLGSALAHEGGSMLAYYVLLHVLTHVFGYSQFVLRFPSALATAAAVAIVCVLAKRMFGRGLALASGLLFAVSLSLVYWGQTARGYALLIALVSGSFLAFVTLLERPGASWRVWLAYVALTTGATYVGPEASLIVPAQLIALYWHRDKWRRVVSAVVAAGAGCIPLAVIALERGAGQLFWVPRPSVTSAKQSAQALASAGLQPHFYTSTGHALMLVTTVLLAAACFKVLAKRATSGEFDYRTVLLLSWMVVPVALVLLISLIGQSIFQPRYVLMSLPPVSLLLAWTIVDRRLPRALVAVGLGALLALRALQVAPAYGVSVENWNEAAPYVIAHAASGDCMAFYPSDAREAFKYYIPRGAGPPPLVLPPVPWSSVPLYLEDYSTLSAFQLSGLRTRCSRVWLVFSHPGSPGNVPQAKVRHFQRLQALRAGLAANFPVQTATQFANPQRLDIILFAR
jgi:mannosyltransferase